MKVLFSHAYSMTEVRRLCERSECPRQHLWGADALERVGHEVEWGPFGGDERLARLTRLTRGKLGYLDQELAMARAAGRDGLVYSGDQNLTRGLAYLRRRRLMSVFHSIGAPPRAGGSWVRGVDVALCLSGRTRDVLVDGYRRDPGRTPVVSWGPDLEFAGYGEGEFELVVSSGKTGRDLSLLQEAVGRTKLAAKVWGLSPEGSPSPLADVLADVRRASVVAIPLADPERLLGLSELNDALACGKPVVMTRSPHFDFDIEAEGFGVWAEAGDAASFARGLSEVTSDLSVAHEMGERAREFARSRWNYGLFCQAVVEAVRGL